MASLSGAPLIRRAAYRPQGDAVAGLAHLGLAGVVILGAMLRFYNLGGPSLWADEIAAVAIAKQPLHVLWSAWMVRETNPPLYYSALHLWMGLFGSSDAAVRSLSALVGASIPPLIYVLGRQLANRRVGLIAALFAALWSHQIFYSQEARGYILGAAGALIAVIGLGRLSDQAAGEAALGRAARAWPWLAYGLGAVIALYTHTTHVLLPFLANLYFVWLWVFRSERRPSTLLAWTAVNAVVVGLWAWWGYITWLQLHLAQPNFGWIGKPSLSQGISMVLNLYGPAGVTTAKSLGRTVMLGVGGAFIAGAAFGLARLRPDRAVMLAVFAVGAPVLLFVISQKAPIMLPRTMLWAQFAVIIGLASAIAAVRQAALRAALVGAVAALLAVGGFIQTPKEPWRPLTAELGQRVGAHDVVLVSSVSDGVYLQHYCAVFACRFPVIDLISPTDNQNRWAEGLFKGALIPPSALPALLAAHPIVWTVSRWADDPRPALAPVATKAAELSLHAALPEFMAVAAWRRR
jgi:4-amino-4-deoxy-L-arabinose transferase-like glycosyltransferase